MQNASDVKVTEKIRIEYVYTYIMPASPEFHAACLCASVRQLSRVLTQAYDDALRPSGLRSTQFLILMNIAGLGQARPADLVARLDIDQTTLTRSLDRLEAQRLIQPVGSADQRERRITLTAQGRRALDRAQPLWANIQASLQRTLGPRNWNRFHRQLLDVRRATTSASL